MKVSKIRTSLPGPIVSIEGKTHRSVENWPKYRNRIVLAGDSLEFFKACFNKSYETSGSKKLRKRNGENCEGETIQNSKSDVIGGTINKKKRQNTGGHIQII